MRARSREWNGFRMTSIVGSVVLCALGHVYPITRAFICTRRRFRFARSIPHTRPDVIRIRIVSSSPLSGTPNTRLWPSAQLVHRPAISRGETNAESQVFLIALHGILRRPPSLLSFPTFPNLDRPRIEHSILRSIDSCFLAPNRPLLNSTETFLLANEFRDFPSISHSTRGTTPLVKFPSKFHDR